MYIGEGNSTQVCVCVWELWGFSDVKIDYSRNDITFENYEIFTGYEDLFILLYFISAIFLFEVISAGSNVIS